MMSFDHKAYQFNWQSFDRELHGVLVRCLAADDPNGVAEFVDVNLNNCTDPYEGAPLTAEWRSTLENRDVHEIGDYALTKYYQVENDFGLAAEWLDVIEQIGKHIEPATLGFALGPDNNRFDPGRMGSYFQTVSDVEESLRDLKPIRDERLAPYLNLLKHARNDGAGIYVTF